MIKLPNLVSTHYLWKVIFTQSLCEKDHALPELFGKYCHAQNPKCAKTDLRAQALSEKVKEIHL